MSGLATSFRTVIIVGLIIITLSACDNMPSASPPTTPTATAADGVIGSEPTSTPGTGTSGTQEVQVTLKEWAVIPAVITVSPGHVRFVITNVGALSHNFTILDSSGTLGATRTFAASESPQTLELDLKPGTYDTLCSVPGHAQHGQRGTLIVK